MSDALSLKKVAERAKVLVILGPGGVGKTTTSLALAIGAAKSGKRVALLSVDPAKRLADALGIELGSDLVKVDFPEGSVKGSLSASMIDQKAIFDQMIHRFVKDETSKQKIFDHRLYKALSSNLAGPLEYLSLAKLHELVKSKSYDLVVLDTPPESQALDFLARPNLLAGFMEKKVINWLIKPFTLANKLGFGKVLSLGERLMGGVAQIVGIDALRSLADFVMLMQSVIEGFHETGQSVLNTLRSNSTQFLLITKPSHQGGRTALSMAEQLYGMSFDLHGVMLNRCLPKKVLAQVPEALKNEDLCPEDSALHKMVSNVGDRYESELKLANLLETDLEKIFGKSIPVWELVDQTISLHSVEGMLALSDDIFSVSANTKTSASANETR